MTSIDSLAESLADDNGENYADPDINRSYKRWVRESVEELWYVYSWSFRKTPFTVTTAPGAATYTVPIGVDHIVSFRYNSQGRTLEHRTDRDITAMGINVQTSGIPWIWTWAGYDDSVPPLRQIRLIPVPDAEYEYPAVGLTDIREFSDSDPIPLPFDFMFALRSLSRSRVLENMDDAKGAEQKMEQYKGHLNTLKDRYLIEYSQDMKIMDRDVSSGVTDLRRRMRTQPATVVSEVTP